MRSTERPATLWQLLCGALLGLYLSAPAYAFTPSDSPLLTAAAVAPVADTIFLSGLPTCSNGGYAFYKNSLMPQCLVELDAFSGKMLNYAVLDSNGDGVVDSTDMVSSGVIFTGGIPTLNAIVNGATRKIVNDSSGGSSTLVEKSGGGSRRIMWRQIQ